MASAVLDITNRASTFKAAGVNDVEHGTLFGGHLSPAYS